MDAPETLLEFPCRFPVKVFGRAGIGLEAIVLEIARDIVPDLGPDDLRLAHSRGRRYTAVTLSVTAESRAQLDRLYRALTGHPDVLMVL